MTSYQSLPADEGSPASVANNSSETATSSSYSIRKALILCTTLCLIAFGTYQVEQRWFPALKSLLFPDSTRTELGNQQISQLASSEVPLASAPSPIETSTMASRGKYSVG